MGLWCDIPSLLNRPHPFPHPKPCPHVIFAFLTAMRAYNQRVLPICGKSGHVSTILMNELQHILLWMVGQRIGSTVTWSRKTKSFA